MKPDDIDDDPWPMAAEVRPSPEAGPRRDPRPHRHRSAAADLFRRAFDHTMGSVHSTSSTSWDTLQNILSTTDRTRRELVRIVASEVGDFMKHVDFASEVTKILTSVQADVHVSVRFKRNPDGGVEPRVARAEPEEPEQPGDGPGEPE